MSEAKIENKTRTLSAHIRDLMQYRGWKSDTLRMHFAECESVDDLVDKCRDEDPNVRIAAAWLLSQVQSSEWQVDSVVEALQSLLDDDRCNETTYAGLAADDEEAPTRVADVAAEALDRIKPDWRRPRTPK